MSEWVPGRNPVREALRSDRVTVVEIYRAPSAGGAVVEEIQRLAGDRGIPLHRVPEDQIVERVEDRGYQGVLARIEEFPILPLPELLDGLPGSGWWRLVVLDQVQDPVNLGKLARSSLFFGAGGLVKTRDRSAPVTPTAIRTSAGALLHLPVAAVTNLSRALEELRERRFWSVGLLAEAERTVEEVPRDRHLALVLGNEESGLRRLTREGCDYRVAIRGSGQFESLNVATAGAVASYALRPPGDEPGG